MGRKGVGRGWGLGSLPLLGRIGIARQENRKNRLAAVLMIEHFHVK